MPPVLRIWPGDTVRTRTVDAAGVDEKGKARVLGGNPQTGPFYVEGAMPGDALAVHVRKLRLNRDTAISDDGLVDRAVNNDYAADHKDDGFKDVVWKLDAERGVATLASPTPRLKELSVPLRPMLGCVAVAPGFGAAEVRTGDSGRFGGNMDFSGIREGATVYLPVAQPGALLYVGDGHALQGDGELNGNALETSLDVEITVELIREKPLQGPRVENAEYLMADGPRPARWTTPSATRPPTSRPGCRRTTSSRGPRPRSSWGRRSSTRSPRSRIATPGSWRRSGRPPFHPLPRPRRRRPCRRRSTDPLAVPGGIG